MHMQVEIIHIPNLAIIRPCTGQICSQRAPPDDIFISPRYITASSSWPSFITHNKIVMKKHLLIGGLSVLLFLSSCSKKGGGDDPEPEPPDVEQKDITGIDNSIAAFMSKYSIPGVQVAITKNEKLVYVKSYGINGGTDNAPINNNNLFRLASVSKPITALGIMKLVETGKLTLDQKVFGTGSILGTDFPSTRLASFSDITVKQLLTHATGAWPNDGNDPMFLQTQLNQSKLISWTLDNQPAGTRGVYRYSNFGYCLLGRIIEKVSGKQYEKFMKEDVLAPAGANGMQIGRSKLNERLPNEVMYNGQNGENPYIYDYPRMDAHGGWIASATDLMRMLVKYDGFGGKTDLLKPATLQSMTTVGVANSGYACGWQVNSLNNWFHQGSLPGTATNLVRTAKGYNWVILCNSRSRLAGFQTALDGLIWPSVNATDTPWQDIDQF
ncbi:MAG: class A beta-lactamase-related serine hydrolase [Chitinophagaceae bacterium]|nr:MAG: class A beta-lactamase-related serine hydrolase [Chitinophagaceae bacterium]